MPPFRRSFALALVGVVVVLTACVAPVVKAAPQPAPPKPVAGPGTSIDGCPVLPANNAWNQDVSTSPVRSDSARFIANIDANGFSNLHPDFGGSGAYGIPFTTVAGGPLIPIHFTAYGDESDPGPYPVPLNSPVEGGASSGGDRHVITVDTSTCMLYEMYNAHPEAGFWNADSGAVWNLRSNKLRPAGWTSADAAGLPILPGLARYAETATGTITHAMRFTVRRSQAGTILPATHFAATCVTDCTDAPPMGMRFRLKAGFDVSGYHGEAKAILGALKKYGMIVADNGSNWYISGDGDPRWNDDDLNQLKAVPGTAFEVVNTGPIAH
jgi:hypothetical protein